MLINRVHTRDVINNMLDHKIEKSCDFLWSIQLKYVYKDTVKEATDFWERQGGVMLPSQRHQSSVSA